MSRNKLKIFVVDDDRDSFDSLAEAFDDNGEGFQSKPFGPDTPHQTIRSTETPII